jgi:glycosyltransferase involved in cell wall biosynthesis
MSSPLPLRGSVASRFASFLKPDLVLVQSKKSENLFQEMGMITKLVPLSGIDLKTFVPINKMEKEILRQKYNLNTDKFIILHVGHIRHGRNIRLLKKLAKYRDIQIIIIGSTSTGMDDDLYKELIKTDCLIITDYIKKIEEFYQLSDCYLFPTTSVINCIQFPISVLEAMACNIPVITTKFGALYDYFNEEDGLVFIGDGKIDKYVELIKSGSIEVKTRMMVSDFSWENISADLEDIYEQFVCE